jgi:unsaturated rhamnogalacturonyl hydrolase
MLSIAPRMAAAAALALAISACYAAPPKPIKEFSNWPAGASPAEIGKRVAERFVEMPHLRKNVIVYPEVCAWYGAFRFAEATHDKDLTARLLARLDHLMDDEPSMIPTRRHVDYSVFGVVPLEAYIETKDPKYLKLGQMIADRQWKDPRPDGLTEETRFWVDDMFMITTLQVQAYRATGDAKYIQRAALEMTAYLAKLQQPNGLFYHAPDVPFFWGRGDGWFAVGMSEVLQTLPRTDPKYPHIMTSYKKMMAALLKYQGKDGMWRELIDHPEAWPETSSTGMFTFAMVTGVRHGWLSRKYAKAARKAWLALITYINPDGDIRNVCEGTSKKNDLQYYLDRARKTGDLHGQAPVMWTATALLQ